MAEQTNQTEDESDGTMIFTIPTSRLEGFKTSVEKLQKKAAKMNFEITMEVGETFDKKIRIYYESLERHITETRQYTYVTVVGEVPIIDGWMFIASLDYSAEFGAMINKLPSAEEEIPARYLKDGGDSTLCEHCHTKRQRLKSYIMKNVETNEWIQVGSTCIKNFTGHASPEQLARYWQIATTINDLDEPDDFNDMHKGSREERGVWPLVSYLSHISAIVGKVGYVSKSKASEENLEPTVEYLENWIFHLKDKAKHPYNYVSRATRFDGLRITDYDVDMAEKTVKWTKNISDSKANNNSYNNNIRNIAIAGEVPSKHEGFAASMIPNYLRNNITELVVENSEFYPAKVGDTITVNDVKVVSYRAFTKEYTTHLYKFQKGSYMFTWFSTRDKHIKEGDTINFSAKIKKFDTFKEIKQTIITRAKIHDEPQKPTISKTVQKPVKNADTLIHRCKCGKVEVHGYYIEIDGKKVLEQPEGIWECEDCDYYYEMGT